MKQERKYQITGIAIALALHIGLGALSDILSFGHHAHHLIALVCSLPAGLIELGA